MSPSASISASPDAWWPFSWAACWPCNWGEGAGELPDDLAPVETRLRSRQRLILLTDGITHRHTEDGGHFGADGLRQAVAAAPDTSAASTTMAIQRALTDCWREALEDDATVVVFAAS